jgi:predicted dehydrogenase
MTREIRWGIIGVGAVAPKHAAAIKALPQIKLVAACDLNASAAEHFGREHAAEFWCADYRELVARPDVDAVTIALPHHLHEQVAVEVAAAGKHVLIEKPLAITAAEAQHIINACNQSGVKLTVGYQNRFDPLASKLFSEIRSGRLGRLLLASLYVKWYRDKNYYQSVPWRGDWDRGGGGVLINQASHGVDLFLWLEGTIKRVSAQMAILNHDIEVEDSIQALVQFDNGAFGVIEATTCAYPGFSIRLELSGTNGTAIYEPGNNRLHWHLLNEKKDWVDETPKGSLAGHTVLYHDFVTAIYEDRPPLIDGAAALRSVELIQAIYYSARAETTVKLTQS